MAMQKVAIVTGANSGIGFRAAQLLCQKGVEVILACRNDDRGMEAERKIKESQEDAKLQYMQLDLGNLSSVQKFANEFLALNKPLHILVDNAGLYDRGGTERHETSDGFELHFGTNHIGHFLLTNLLLDKLKQSGTPEAKARIVVVASLLHDGKNRGQMQLVHDIDFDDLNLLKEGVYSGSQGYKNSKAANVMFTYKLARVLENDNITVNVMCPGFIPTTELGRNQSKFKRFMLRWVLDWALKPIFNITRPIDHGAGMIVELGTDPKHEGESGLFFSDYQVIASSEESRDVEKQEKLWTLTKSMIIEKFPDIKLI